MRRLKALGAGTAIIAASLSPLILASTASAATLTCRTSVGDTGGWAECKGQGTWRVKSVCNNERDQYTSWTTQNSSSYQRVYAVDCSWEIEDVVVERR